MSIARAENGFGEADAALSRGDDDAAASLIDRLIDVRSLQRTDWTRPLQPSDAHSFNRKLCAAEQLIRHQPCERLLALDPAGRVLLYLRGTGSRVPLPIDEHGRTRGSVMQRLAGARCLTHNHPVEGDRPIGGTLSLSDIVLAQRFEIAELRVAAPEASYSLRPTGEAKWDATWVTATERVYQHGRDSLDRAMAAAPGSPHRDIYFYLRVFDFLMVQFSKRLGLLYERLDQPRQEWARAIPSPAQPTAGRASPLVIDDDEHFRWMTSVLRP